MMIIQTVLRQLCCLSLGCAPPAGANRTATSGHASPLPLLPVWHICPSCAPPTHPSPQPTEQPSITVVAEPCRVMMLMMSHLSMPVSCSICVLKRKEKKGEKKFQAKHKSYMSSVLALLYFCVKSCHYFLKIKEKRKTACSVKVMGPNQCIVG